jgi:Alternative complex III, ActD subunit
MSGPRPAYGLMAEFTSPHEVVAAAHLVHDRGFRKVDGYSPYPIEELGEALGLHRSRLPPLVLTGGVLGLVGGLGLEYWTSAVAYPMNIGGRPLGSWVAFIPPAFETTVLLAALTAVLGMLALNGLPQPYHPVFNVPSFALASRDRFFICVESRDPLFDAAGTRKFLEELPGVKGVHEVQP